MTDASAVDFGQNLTRKASILQQQQQMRLRLRHQKLRVSLLGYVVVLVFFVVLQFIGVYFFSQGFLLLRQVLPEIAHCNGTENCMPAKFDKAVVFIIDALRFDFAIPVDENPSPYYHNHFPILHELAQSQPNNAVLLKFMADPPTTTLQRLKGLTTGSLPTFIDAGSNFNGDAITEDNWLLQLHKANKSVAFMGDDTWSALFDDYLNPDLNFPYESLNVWDLHTVDNGVIKNMMPLLEKSRQREWDVLIGHCLGVDHAGHRYGPSHHAMKDKLQEMNEVVRQIIEKVDDKTLLVIMGDHGMDPTGNHGGDSTDELESTIFFYLKKAKFGANRHALAAYDTSALGSKYRSVNQIDLVPTMSLLLGLPIPFNNLGFPIDEIFGKNELARASHLTIEQIQRFRDLSSDIDDDPQFSESLSSLFEGYNNGTIASLEFIEISKVVQSEFLELCKSLWARFDLVKISLGIGILLLSLSFLITYSRSIPSVRVSTMSFEFIGSVVAMTLLGVVSSVSIYVVLRPTGMSFKNITLCGAAVGISIGLWAPVMDRFSVAWLGHQVVDFFTFNLNTWSFLGLCFVLFHSVIFASNSYVVWEDKVIHLFVSTFGFACLYGCAVSQKSIPQRLLGATHAVTFIILSRLIQMINLCREEQRPICVPTFKTSWWSILLLYLAAFIVPRIIKAFYMLTDTYHSAAPLWIESGMTVLMIANAVYWTLEFVENDDYFLTYSKLWLGTHLLKSFKLGIARIVLFVALVLANFSWSRGPLCVRIELSAPELLPAEGTEGIDGAEAVPAQPTATILGHGNVYGSSYFLLVINIAVAVLLVSKPLGALSISMMLVQILSLLELYTILDMRKNLVAPIMFGLLGYQHFFSTGHQATIPSIQWEIGFMTTQSIVFPFTHLNIALNTFGSFIIAGLSVPLITFWRLPPSAKPITVLSQVVTNVTTLLTYHTIISVVSFVFAAHFRRHLMVWKIFAPRFMVSALLLIVYNLILPLFTIWFAAGRILTQVNRIFGK